MVSPRSAATLSLFILSIIFVIQPLKVPIGRKGHIHINLLTAPLIAIVVLLVSRCIEFKTVWDGIAGTDGVKPYNILILFFSLAYMSITLDITGVLKGAAHWVSNISGKGTMKLYINFYIMVTALSAVLGNDPVILSGTLFLLYYTDANKLDGLPWLMSEFAAANTASMILFVGNPTNVVICEGFGIQNAAFSAYTILPFIGCSVTCLVALYIQNRMLKTLPPRLEKNEIFNIRDDINDPVAAVVGSVLLCGCLLTALVVSFLAIDVWMITLPFALAKLAFDIVWNLYRTRRRHGDDENPLASALPSQPDPDHVSTTSGSSPMSTNSMQPLFDKKEAMQCLDPLGAVWKVQRSRITSWIKRRQPTLWAAFPRLPFALVPFAFSQFILIEALASQGWIDIFAKWLSVASRDQMFPVIWIVGLMGVILCNIAGTNIGATILLTKVVRAANLSVASTRAAGIALAVASNIGAVSFVFSASLAGLLWKQIIDDHLPKHTKKVTQWTFAKWNITPLLVMTSVGLGVVSAEMAYLYRQPS